MIAQYGNKIIRREYCKSCKSFSLIDKQENFLCCGEHIPNKNNKNKIMIEATKRRKKPHRAEQKKIIDRQNGYCLYCGVKFGMPLWREDKRKLIFASPCFDHFVPFSYSYNNKKVNFVAACRICNSIKSNKMFDTVEEAKDYIKYHRAKKGIKTFEETVEEKTP